MVVATTPEDERDFGVEGSGKRSMPACGCGATVPGIPGPCKYAHPVVTGLRRVHATRGSGAAGYARRHDLNDLLESKDDDAPNRTG
jgi:hypothetical protein